MQRIGFVLGLGIVGVFVLLGVRSASAHGLACAAVCHGEARDCRFDAREEAMVCFEESGCGELRDVFRDACLVEERDEEACDLARDEYRDCVQPCREALRDARRDCRGVQRDCIVEQCEGSLRGTRPGHHRPGPLRRPGRFRPR